MNFHFHILVSSLFATTFWKILMLQTFLITYSLSVFTHGQCVQDLFIYFIYLFIWHTQKKNNPKHYQKLILITTSYISIN